MARKLVNLDFMFMAGKINARDKGHTFERRVVKLFKDRGFSNCTTSRFTNRRLDALKVDIDGLKDFNIQCKAVEKLGPPHGILASMPKRKGVYNLLWHKINRKGTVICMTEEDFLSILDALIDKGVIKPECLSS